MKLAVFLITGGSGCGKSTLANRLQDEYLKKDILTKVIHQDDYFLLPFLPYSERVDLSYESDQGIDFKKIKSDISINVNLLVNEASIACHDDFKKTDEIVLIVEGHMIGAAAEMLYDADTYIQKSKHVTSMNIITVIFDTDRETSKKRRLYRRQRSQKELDELEHYFDTAVWPGYLKYGRPALEALRNIPSMDKSSSNITVLELCASHSIESHLEKIETIRNTIV
ncbi:hypothetical protein CTEN210_00418 [Chaetoceros tenuissimus]|uniref:Uridine kinase n=1 Tax=Chaetoceros tenuissimus TaxID=426638 RepID=A0AAD3CE28_9STRA|nr:hypothetical protein CTEN210_00418 [Chaetoceros tenuissimus]